MTGRPDTVNQLRTRALDLRYGDRLVVGGLDLTLPGGAVTAIVGPNACGKSTLLRGLSRLLAPAAGTVTLDGSDIHRMSAKALALRMGLLPQQPVTPEAITVEALVRLGRYPHQRLLAPGRRPTSGRSTRPWSAPARPRCATSPSTGSPAASANAPGSRWRWRRTPSCSCSTNRPPSSIFGTSSTYSIWSPPCTPRRAAPW